MSGLDVTAAGLQTFRQTLGAAADDLDDLTRLHAELGDLVVAGVHAPVVTGRLTSTVRAVPGPDGFTLTAGGPEAPYAAAVHARNPFLARGLTEREETVINRYADHVQDVVDSIRGA